MIKLLVIKFCTDLSVFLNHDWVAKCPQRSRLDELCSSKNWHLQGTLRSGSNRNFIVFCLAWCLFWCIGCLFASFFLFLFLCLFSLWSCCLFCWLVLTILHLFLVLGLCLIRGDCGGYCLDFWWVFFIVWRNPLILKNPIESFVFCILELHEYTGEIFKNFHEKNWFEIKEEIATSYLAWKSLNVV